MIVVAGTVRIVPHRREEAVRLALWMSTQTEAEAGCLGYRFYSALHDQDTILIFERWDSDAALQAHFQTPHMGEFSRQLGPLLAGQPEIVRYTVSDHAPI